MSGWHDSAAGAVLVAHGPSGVDAVVCYNGGCWMVWWGHRGLLDCSLVVTLAATQSRTSTRTGWWSARQPPMPRPCPRLNRSRSAVRTQMWTRSHFHLVELTCTTSTLTGHHCYHCHELTPPLSHSASCPQPLSRTCFLLFIPHVSCTICGDTSAFTTISISCQSRVVQSIIQRRHRISLSVDLPSLSHLASPACRKLIVTEC